MFNRISVVCVVLALVTTILPSFAADPASDKVAPLGFALGEATRSSVQSSMRGKAELKAGGTNYYSGGPMFTTKGAGLGIEGLQEVLLIFDSSDVLVALRMTLDKELDRGFDKAYGRLIAKYPLVKKSVPFVGNKQARFEKGNAVIELDAPHLSFSMTATYMTRGFENSYKQKSRKDAEAKERQEGSRF